MWLNILLSSAIIGLVAIWVAIRRRSMHIWLGSYLIDGIRLNKDSHIKARPTHIMFAFVDHFEPRWENPSYAVEVERIERWVKNYPKLARKFRDADSRYPQHTFFYPQEEYRTEHIEKLTGLCRQGFGEVEIHLHHDHDTAEGLREKLEDFKEKLIRQNLLSRNEKGDVTYGFVHGNWTLDNSGIGGRMCGVDNELEVLKETGCYADFTLPSAPSETQTKKINSIYYAKDDPCKPKSHDTGIDVKVGRNGSGDIMVIQGPLALNWRKRKYGILPRIENAEISSDNPPSKDRVDMWIERRVHVKGKPDWVFVKVHTHGAQEANVEALFGRKMEEMHAYLETGYNSGKECILHYVTTREMFNIIKAAEDGLDGNPNDYRNYILKRNSYGI